MANITWLGDVGGDESVAETLWNGQIFKKGEAVVTDDPYFISKASGNRFFTVTGVPGVKPVETKSVPQKPVTPPPGTTPAPVAT